MKTYNYGIELMLPMQVNKEIIFNEALVSIDSFCNSSVAGFVEEAPEQVSRGKKYIITNGDRANQICYCVHESKGWQYLDPKPGMVIFSKEKNAFLIFENNAWQNVDNCIDDEKNYVLLNEGEQFMGVSGEVNLENNSSKILYIYLVGDCVIDLSNMKPQVTTIIIKQNYEDTYNIEWSYNVLWSNNERYSVTDIANSIDLIELYPLAETKYFIAKVIGKNYSF